MEQFDRNLNPELMEQLAPYFMRGDIPGAMAYMKQFQELQAFLHLYTDLFEHEHYISYDIPPVLNEILLVYQQYYRAVFYLQTEEDAAAEALFDGLRSLLKLPNADEAALVEALERIFAENGYHILCGKTTGHYGPYIWKTTEPTTYTVELPNTVSQYTVNILRDFVSRSWMDYLTFGGFGTGGWASPDGTINCIASEYDFEGERFQVSLLKHEAQHVEDMKRWPQIQPKELEYRAKLVELMYAEQRSLLEKFLKEADSSQPDNSHAAASVRLAEAFGEASLMTKSEIQKKAAALFASNTAELSEKYGC